ncbi:MAG: helix-turn-helix domain-containing protein [Rhodospirillales bacterium]|nr:helix-turn-helix domain-containing protein [Rhodospirillales bacterium]
MERALSLNEAAALLGWSRRTLIRALARHGIPTIGTGRRARLEATDLERLKAKEREVAREARGYSKEEAIAQTRWRAKFDMDERIRRHMRRRLGQLTRRKKAP